MTYDRGGSKIITSCQIGTKLFISYYKEGRMNMAEKVYPENDIRLHRLINDNLSYDTFRAEACHMYHFDGDYLFISKVMKTNLVMILWDNKEYVKALYMLAMIDYISWKNEVPLFQDYISIRSYKLEKPLFPSEVIMLDKIENSNKNKEIALETCKKDECGRFFFRHNIIERSI